MDFINLDQILNADEKSLKEEHNAFFESLKTFDSKEVSGVNELRRIFEVMQKVVGFRDQQQEEEIDTLKMNLKKYQDPDRLSLSQQLMLSEQLLGTDSEDVMLETHNMMVSRLGKLKVPNTNLLQLDLYEMEERIRDLTEENYELHTVITNAKQITEKYYKQVLQLKKEKSELKEEKQMLRQDFIKYRRQVETQWEDLIDNMEEKMQNSTERIHSLELQLTQTAEKVENLMARVKSKRTECYRLKRELRETIKSLYNSRKSNVSLKTTLHCEDISKEMMKTMNEELKSKILSLLNEKKCRDETDEAISKSVNQKVSEWKKLLDDKEEMIVSLQDKLSHLKNQLRNYHKNIPNSSIIASFNEELIEKDVEISQLAEKIRFLTEMREKHVGTIKDIENLFKIKTLSLREEIEEGKTFRELIEKEMKEIQTFASETEDHAFEKDKDLCETLKRMHQYEKNYGLDDAMKEIKCLQQKVKIRDRRIEELVRLLNKYDENLSQQMEEKERQAKGRNEIHQK